MAETNHMYRERVRREVVEQYRKQHQSAGGSASNDQVPSTTASGLGAVALGSNLLGTAPGIAGASLVPGSYAINVRGASDPSGPPAVSSGRLSPVSTSSRSTTSEVEVLGGKTVKDSGPRKTGIRWNTGDATRVFMMQVRSVSIVAWVGGVGEIVRTYDMSLICTYHVTCTRHNPESYDILFAHAKPHMLGISFSLQTAVQVLYL